MELSAVAAFALVAVTLIVMPGPDWAFVLASGVRERVVGPAVLGLMLGYAAITAVVALGVGPVVAASSTALLALTLCGAGYLVYLGVKVLRTSSAPARHLDGDPGPASPRRHYVLRGAGVSALNPKGLLIFLSILPQFTRPGAGWPLPAQLAVLGAVFTMACGVFYLFLGVTSDRVLAARPEASEVTAKIAGAAMVLVGVLLLVERLVTTSH
jgi:threonine/homoserine/homoserine lactone efflux protein